MMMMVMELESEDIVMEREHLMKMRDPLEGEEKNTMLRYFYCFCSMFMLLFLSQLNRTCLVWPNPETSMVSRPL